MDTRKEFLRKIESAAFGAARDLKTPVVPAAVAAQAALESNWGRSQLAIEGRNLFGVRAGSSWDGLVIELPTWEIVDGHRVEAVARFRRYGNVEAAVRDYVGIIGKLDWYRDAREAARYGDPYGFIYGIEARGEPGWATDPEYAKKILSIMREYGLIDGPHPVWADRVYIDGGQVDVERVSIARTDTAGTKLYITTSRQPCPWWRRIWGRCVEDA